MFIGVRKMHSALSQQHKQGYQRFIHPTAGHKGTSMNLKCVLMHVFKQYAAMLFAIVHRDKFNRKSLFRKDLHHQILMFG